MVNMLGQKGQLSNKKMGVIEWGILNREHRELKLYMQWEFSPK